MTGFLLLGGAFALAVSLAMPAGAQTWKEIVAAAEKEGELSLIVPPVKAHRDTIMLFQNAFPKIKVKATGMAPQESEPRLAAERKSDLHLWDATITGVGAAVYDRHIPGGWYQSVEALVRDDIKKDALWLAGWKAGYMDKGQIYAYGFAGNVSPVFLVDRAQIPESSLATMEDLLKPEFKGKIALYDPRAIGPGGFALASAYIVMGEDKVRRLLVDQEPVLTGTLRQIVEWSVRGRYPITIGAPIENVVPYQQQGVGKSVEELKIPSHAKGVGANWGNVLAFNPAPHPNATRVFVNWMLEKEAQADWASRGLKNSRRTDVPKGMVEIAATESDWKNGLLLSSEKQAELRRKVNALAIDVLKGRETPKD